MSARAIIHKAALVLSHAQRIIIDSVPINDGAALRRDDTLDEIERMISDCDIALTGPPIDWDGPREGAPDPAREASE